MKNNASLKERFAGWLDWDIACYNVGACLGFWTEFGAPYDHDSWHGVKSVIWSANPLGDAIANFLEALVVEGCLEKREGNDIAFRWNPNYKGQADILTILE
jgi:hypothetical protein